MLQGFQERIFNFSAGPSTLPLSVIEQAKEELQNYSQTGMSIMEMSHRSSVFEELLAKIKLQIKSILNLSDEFEILLLQGGARHQFAMIPLNFLSHGKVASFVDTGYWTSCAVNEASQVGEAITIKSSKDQRYSFLPEYTESEISDRSAYLHLCSNNTIAGTQWVKFVRRADIPCVIDMSSDIASRKIDYDQFDLIFAGAQKNLGPAGITLVLIKKAFTESTSNKLPEILRYKTHIDSKSLYNTAPTFIIYMLGLVLSWIEDQGGIDQIEKRNREKSDLLYRYIDSDSFYQCPVRNKNDRSMMNIVFRIKEREEELTKKFVQDAEAHGLSGLKGHRIVGGLRASLYNAQSLVAVESLIDFMKEFKSKNG